MSAPFTPALRTELAKLDDVAILTLLGEIVEPSQGCPFAISEELCGALEPVADVYRDLYVGLLRVAHGDVVDPDAAMWTEADYRYDEARSLAPVRHVAGMGWGA